MMNAIDILEGLVKKFEGCKLKAYFCPAGAQEGRPRGTHGASNAGLPFSGWWYVGLSEVK